MAELVTDARLLDAVAVILARDGLAGLSISAIADEAKVSRVTLHRRGLTVGMLVVSVLRRASDDLRASLWPALTGAGDAATRLQRAFEIMCEVAERHAGTLSALFRAPVRPLPDAPDRTTSFEFVEPFERLLADGNLDGSLRSDDPGRDATLLANAVTWTYLHMREAHHWTPEETSRVVIEMVMARVCVPGHAGSPA